MPGAGPIGRSGVAEGALLMYGIYMSTAFGWRSWIQRRETGSTGFVGVSGRPGSIEWLAGALFVLAILLGAAAPLLAIADVIGPLDALDRDWVNWLGLLLAIAGNAATLDAQVAMGHSWRIGVDHGERTELVFDGPFRIVRNPIFAAMVPTAAGLMLMVPNIVAILGVFMLCVAVQLQVRVMEEPYLLRTHGEPYLEYARTVGRFVPGVGKL